MSGPDLIDERFDDLVAELRAAEVTASPELRERVRAIAERDPEPPIGARLGRLRRRRVALVLVPVAAALGVAVGLGALGSGGGGRQAVTVLRSAENGSTDHLGKQSAGLAHPRSTPAPSDGVFGATPKAPAPSGSRAQMYEADLRLRVADLSATTRQAIQLIRGWGGYVVAVDYGSGQTSGTAYLDLRVPIVKVQTAVARLTSLGTILNDHISIQDVQGQLNQRYSRMQDLKARIAKLRADLTEPGLTTSQKAFFQAALAQRLAQLTKLQQQQAAQKTRASFATVTLDLQTKQAAVVVPSKPGRIGQALHNIGRVLVTEAEVLIYVLLIGAPFIALAALLWLSRRTLRRRSEDQLLAR